MTDQLALDLRDDGADRALLRDEAWVRSARAFVSSLRSGELISANDVVARCGLPRGVSKNAVGGLLIALEREGVTEATGKWVRSTRVARRGGWIQVWRRKEAP